jgi:hypothetical protein
VADHFVAAVAVAGDQLGAVLVVLRVHDHADVDAQLVEQLGQAPAADPVAVLAPHPAALAPRFGLAVEIDPATGAEREVLDVHRDVDGQALAVRPFIDRSGIDA